MALFERPTVETVSLLSRLGFAARLRWELSDTYLTLTPTQTLTRTSTRSSSTIFFFLSNSTPTLDPHLCAVISRSADSPDFNFLSLSSRPQLTSTPSLLKISFSTPILHNRCLISLQHPAPSGGFLSLSGNRDATVVAAQSKHELFHLEFVPGSIGAGFVASQRFLPALSVSQAVLHALLPLGVRLRLRSVHGRVLRIESGVAGVKPVVQNGVKSRVDEILEKELVMTAFHVDKGEETGEDLFVLKEVETGLVLSIDRENQNESKGKTLRETPLILVEEKKAKPVKVRYGKQGWGIVHLGCGEGEQMQWLMAGRGNKLELRRHVSRWESFTVEFVRQSLDMAVKELPESPIFRMASEVTHAAVRKEVVDKIAKVRGKKDGGKIGGFNHSAALAGLGDEPKKVQKVDKGTQKKAIGASKNGGGGSGGIEKEVAKKQKKKPAMPGPVAVAPTLPRNQMNRKAAKRNKKKKQKAKRSQSALNNAAPVAAGTSGVVAKAKEQSKTSTSNLGDTETTKNEEGSSSTTEDKGMSSASSSTASNASGPPCGACGRRLDGTYTTALGKSFHPGCFCCGKCRRPMGTGAGKFRERGGIPYCNTCYASNIASRCARCSQPIMDTVTTAMEKTWHKECLTCTICRLPLTQTFWLYADKPNEPRCSRCVTGNENFNSTHHGSGRMVNLPMFGKSNSSSMPLPLPMGGTGSSAGGGRARMMLPMLPNTTRK